MHVAGRPVELVLLTRTNIYPRDAREVIWRMDALSANHPGTIPVLVADAISTTAKDLLRTRRAAYYDAGGSLFLCTEPVYVHIDRPSPRAIASRVQSLFRGSRAQVVHCLLLAPSTWFGATRLAEQANVSPGTASVVLRHLEQHEWVQTRGRGPTKKRRVADAGRLLDAWAQSNESVRPFSVRDYYVPVVPEPSLALELHRAFEGHGTDYAITGESAAQRYAPFLSNVLPHPLPGRPAGRSRRRGAPGPRRTARRPRRKPLRHPDPVPRRPCVAAVRRRLLARQPRNRLPRSSPRQRAGPRDGRPPPARTPRLLTAMPPTTATRTTTRRRLASASSSPCSGDSAPGSAASTSSAA